MEVIMSKVGDEIYRYEFNLFAFPERYFENHTAQELRISEEARQKLIEIQKQYYTEYNKMVSHDSV